MYEAKGTYFRFSLSAPLNSESRSNSPSLFDPTSSPVAAHRKPTPKQSAMRRSHMPDFASPRRVPCLRPHASKFRALGVACSPAEQSTPTRRVARSAVRVRPGKDRNRDRDRDMTSGTRAVLHAARYEHSMVACGRRTADVDCPHCGRTLRVAPVTSRILQPDCSSARGTNPTRTLATNRRSASVYTDSARSASFAAMHATAFSPWNDRWCAEAASALSSTLLGCEPKANQTSDRRGLLLPPSRPTVPPATHAIDRQSMLSEPSAVGSQRERGNRSRRETVARCE